MTRDEAKTLAPGTTLRFRDDDSRSRFVRFVAATGYRFADVEAGGDYGIPVKRFRVRYDRVEVFEVDRPTEKRLARRGR